MIRKIKFKAWDRELKCWYKPTYEAYKGNLHDLLISLSGELCAHTLSGLKHESMFPDRYELVQYTGLKDKNGVEIYEGDVLSGHTDGNVKVEFINASWSCVFDDGEAIGLDEMCIWFGNNALVIGNIHQHPELLEPKHEGD